VLVGPKLGSVPVCLGADFLVLGDNRRHFGMETGFVWTFCVSAACYDLWGMSSLVVQGVDLKDLWAYLGDGVCLCLRTLACIFWREKALRLDLERLLR
jgi:hypothetical protein